MRESKARGKREVSRPRTKRRILSVLMLCALLCAQLGGLVSVPAFAAGNPTTITITKEWSGGTAPTGSITVELWSSENDTAGDADDILVNNTVTLTSPTWTESVAVADDELYYYVVDSSVTADFTNDTAPAPIMPSIVSSSLKWIVPTAGLPFGKATYFSVVAFGDFTANTADVESGLAVQGDFMGAHSYRVGIPAGNYPAAPGSAAEVFSWYTHPGGIGLPIMAHTPRMIVGGNVNHNGLTIAGGELYAKEGATIATGENIKYYEYTGTTGYTGDTAALSFSWFDWNKLTKDGSEGVREVPAADVTAFFSEAYTELEAMGAALYSHNSELDGEILGGKVLVVNVDYDYGNAPWGDATKPTRRVLMLTPGSTDLTGIERIIYNVHLQENSGGTAYLSAAEFDFPIGFAGDVVVNLIPENGATKLGFSKLEWSDTDGNARVFITQNGEWGELFADAREYSHRIMWNVPSAITEITANYGFIGSMLAPDTDFKAIGGGTFNGNLVAKNVDVSGAGGWEAHCTGAFTYQVQDISTAGQIKISSTYTPPVTPPATGSITVTKNVTDASDGAKNVTETFYVALFSDSAGTSIVGTPKAINITAASSGTAAFTDLTVDLDYYVFEVASSTATTGIAGGGTFGVYTVNYTGDQKVNIPTTGGDKAYGFTNKETTPPPGSGSIKVNKMVTDASDGAKNVTETFYVALFNDAAGTSIFGTPKAIALAGSNTDEATFGSLAAGETYYIFEVTDMSATAGLAGGAAIGSYTVSYATQEVTVLSGVTSSITVTNKENTIPPVTPPGGGGTTTPNPEPKPAVVNLSAEKTVDGKVPGELSFSFELRAENGALIETVTNNASGLAAFAPLSFEETGSFVYLIREVAGSDGFTYDETVYTVTVTVTKGTDYAAAVSYEKDGAAHTGKLAFENKALSEEQVVSVTAEKRWAGSSTAAYPTSATVQLYKNGEAYGAPVMLHAANGWSYIWEKLSKEESWTVDELDVPTGYAVSISEQGGNFVITNTANATVPEKQPARVVLVMNKSLDGRTPGAARFTFVLKDAAGAVLQEKQNSNSGIVAFDEMSFSHAGEYTFYLSESVGSVPMIQYDQTLYEAVVAVSETEAGYSAVLTYYSVDDAGNRLESVSGLPQFANTSSSFTSEEGLTEYIEMGEDGTPLGKWVFENDEWNFYELNDDGIPLGSMPNTGDGFINGLILYGMISLVLGLYLMVQDSSKKKERNNE